MLRLRQKTFIIYVVRVVENVNEGVLAATGGRAGFDLNQQPATGEEEDVLAAPAAPVEAPGSEVNRAGFDLNQFPPSEDGDHQHRP